MKKLEDYINIEEELNPNYAIETVMREKSPISIRARARYEHATIVTSMVRKAYRASPDDCRDFRS